MIVHNHGSYHISVIVRGLIQQASSISITIPVSFRTRDSSMVAVQLKAYHKCHGWISKSLSQETWNICLGWFRCWSVELAINHMQFMTPFTSYVSCNPRPQMLQYSLHIVLAYGSDKDLECTHGITCADTTRPLQMCLRYFLGQKKILVIRVEKKCQCSRSNINILILEKKI